MSQFNSTNPARGDSAETRRAKNRLKNIIDQVFTDHYHKTWIVEEVPYYSIEEPNPYHLDLAILTRDKHSFDNYSLFAIEIDGPTHESKRSDYKDRTKDKAFYRLGISILHIRLEEVLYGNEAEQYIQKEKELANMIWEFFTLSQDLEFSTKNQSLAIKLKENQLTICRNKKCQHKAYEHNLAGCNFQQPNKNALYCPCKEPFLVSDM